MKHLIGKKVWLMPTGNNTRRYNNEVKEALITKVAKVNVSFIMDGYSREEKLRISDLAYGGIIHLHNECNGGFNVFETLQDIEDFNLANKLRQQLEIFVRSNKVNGLSLETLKTVCELLGQ